MGSSFVHSLLEKEQKEQKKRQRRFPVPLKNPFSVICPKNGSLGLDLIIWFLSLSLSFSLSLSLSSGPTGGVTFYQTANWYFVNNFEYVITALASMFSL